MTDFSDLVSEIMVRSVGVEKPSRNLRLMLRAAEAIQQQAAALEQAENDIQFMLKHPLQSCKACYYADAECMKDGANCHPKWRGPEETKKES